MAVIISSAQPEDLPPYDSRQRCFFHPKARVEHGYGHAGGGIGPYSYCSICCRVLSKSQDPEGQPTEVENDLAGEKIPSVPTQKPEESS